VKATLSTPGASVSGNSTHAGWTVGTGLEYAFAPNWSAKVEYLYVDLGTDTKLATDDVDLKTHVVRAGVNYRYDLSALLGLLPISSKY